MNPLANVISNEIKTRGVIPFERFMDLALYCPDLGYYQRPGIRIGTAGDYFTSVAVGPLFGELLALQFARWIDALNCPKPLLIEAGAHDGTLARDILSAFQSHRPDLAHRIRYCVVEPSAARRESQASTLEALAAQIEWARSWDELRGGAEEGIILANELLDAFPVHRLGWDASRRTWFEWGVGFESGQFHWVPLPPWEPAALPGWLQAGTRLLAEVIPDGHLLEICPKAESWWRQAAATLRRGWLITLDYGLTAEEALSPHRSSGTLRGYRRHMITRDLLASPGEQDLTAHVNFSVLEASGEASGLRTLVFSRQGHFLSQIAAESERVGCPRISWSPRRRRQFATLTHPEHLGERFRVLVQAKLT